MDEEEEEESYRNRSATMLEFRTQREERTQKYSRDIIEEEKRYARRSKVCQKEVYRISVYGDGEVGKSCIIHRYVFGSFIEGYQPTVEDFYQTKLRLCNLELALEIVDTSGTDQFPAMRELNIKHSDIVILVYDASRTSTIKELLRLYKIARNFTVVPIVFVGNKIDLIESGAFLNQEVESFMEASFDPSLYHVICSALLDMNIISVFTAGFNDLVQVIIQASCLNVKKNLISS